MKGRLFKVTRTHATCNSVRPKVKPRGMEPRRPENEPQEREQQRHAWSRQSATVQELCNTRASALSGLPRRRGERGQRARRKPFPIRVVHSHTNGAAMCMTGRMHKFHRAGKYQLPNLRGRPPSTSLRESDKADPPPQHSAANATYPCLSPHPCRH